MLRSAYQFFLLIPEARRTRRDACFPLEKETKPSKLSARLSSRVHGPFGLLWIKILRRRDVLHGADVEWFGSRSDVHVLFVVESWAVF